MTYFDILPLYRVVIQVILLVLLVIQIYFFMSFTVNIRRRRLMIVQSIAIVTNVAMLTVLIGEYRYYIQRIKPSKVIEMVLGMPLWFLIIFILGMGILSLYTAYCASILQKKTITESSIREGTDDLPMGLCFAKKDGMPILVNRKMYMLSLKITGKALQNANHFWEQVVEGELPEGIRRLKEGEEPMILFEDGTTWSFSRDVIEIDKEQMFQIYAIDTTDLYSLGIELRNKNEALKKMNLRLQEYSENVTNLMREEEILATKVRIHADMGNALLATRYYLNNPKGKGQVEELIKMWKYNVSLLYNEAREEVKENVFEQLIAAAEAVGVDIKLKGALPKNDVKAERLIVAAARECLTNTVRHGDGKVVYIDIQEWKGYYHLEYSNNGTVPEETVKEGGGLLGLRKRVEDMNGTMQVVSNPKMILIINIPKERG